MKDWGYVARCLWPIVYWYDDGLCGLRESGVATITRYCIPTVNSSLSFENHILQVHRRRKLLDSKVMRELVELLVNTVQLTRSSVPR